MGDTVLQSWFHNVKNIEQARLRSLRCSLRSEVTDSPEANRISGNDPGKILTAGTVAEWDSPLPRGFPTVTVRQKLRDLVAKSPCICGCGLDSEIYTNYAILISHTRDSPNKSQKGNRDHNLSRHSRNRN